MKMKILASVAIAAAALTSQGASADAFSGIDNFVAGNVLYGSVPGQSGAIFNFAGASTQTYLNGPGSPTVNITNPGGASDAFVSSIDFGPALITTETTAGGAIFGGFTAGDPGNQVVDPLITAEISGDTFAASGVDDNNDQYAITSAGSSSEAYGMVDYGGSAGVQSYMNSCAAATPGGTAVSACFQ